MVGFKVKINSYDEFSRATVPKFIHQPGATPYAGIGLLGCTQSTAVLE